jgi:hypothetical protein
MWRLALFFIWERIRGMTRSRSNRSCARIVGVFSLTCVQLAAVSLPAARGDDEAVPAAGLALGPPVVVAVSPPEYGRDPTGRWWGFFQFPDLWQGNDGSLSVAVHVGADSAAGRHEPTQFFASPDRGRTWRRATVDELDLTPLHVKASADGGRTWCESQPIVGPAEREILAKPATEWWESRNDWSCANTSLVVTGPDRFLVAYSDFRHRDAEGRPCKAIAVREVVVTARPGR